MNDNTTYILQCSKENFDEVHCIMQIFGQILDADAQNYSIRTSPLDSTMKRRLADIGVSFWEESRYAATKPSVRLRA